MRLVMENLPLQENDVLLIMRPDYLTEKQISDLETQLKEVTKRLPFQNKIIVFPMNLTVQALRPLQGKFEVVNQKLTVLKDTDL